MAKNITFHLPICAVHAGVQRRQSALIAEDALEGIRARPLLPRCECAPATAVALAGFQRARSTVQPSFRFVPPPPTPTLVPAQSLAAPFTFSTMLQSAPAAATSAAGNAIANTFDATLWGVSRLAPRPVADVALAWRRREDAIDSDAEVRCKYVDQYFIGDLENPKSGCARFCELLYGTLISNVIPRGRTVDKKTKRELIFSLLLGKTGHYERFSGWSHVVGFVVFALYAVGRQIVAQNRDAVEGIFASISAWTIACVFLASALYHSTAADRDYALITRFIDFAAIYAGLAIGATADIAVATRGFENIPVVTIVDIPIAALILVIFFVWRRLRLSKDETWLDDYEYVPKSVECSLGRGLFSRGHDDLHHSQLREATSLLLTASYFMVVPAAVMTLGVDVAVPVIALQTVGFVLLVGGLMLDKILEWPNGSLVKGEHACCYPNACGCVLTAHGVWHLIALVSAACAVTAREYALSSY